jgi:glycosyltransferase involved in cell wall biosynthesis
MSERTVLINALSATTGGALTVSRGLAAALAGVRPAWKLLLLHSQPDAAPASAPSPLERVAMPALASPARRWRFEQLELPGFARARGVDAAITLGGFKCFGLGVPEIAVWQNAHLWSPPTEGHSLGLRLYIAAQRAVMRATVDRAACNVFLSEDSRRVAGERIDLRRARSEVVSIGPSELFFEPGAPGRSARAPLLLAVGDLYPHKRFELLLHAAARLAPSHPELRVEIAGRPVHGAYAAELEALVQSLGLEDRVRFLGGVGPEALRALYDRARVYLAPSSLETFGLTAVEAMARGVPVAAAARSATPEICGDAACYFEDEPGAIVEVVTKLFDDDALWQSRHEAGLARAERFTWPAIAEQYAGLVESVLQPPEEA